MLSAVYIIIFQEITSILICLLENFWRNYNASIFFVNIWYNYALVRHTALLNFPDIVLCILDDWFHIIGLSHNHEFEFIAWSITGKTVFYFIFILFIMQFIISMFSIANRAWWASQLKWCKIIIINSPKTILEF